MSIMGIEISGEAAKSYRGQHSGLLPYKRRCACAGCTPDRLPPL